jgi:hypothetical protein
MENVGQTKLGLVNDSPRMCEMGRSRGGCRMMQLWKMEFRQSLHMIFYAKNKKICNFVVFKNILFPQISHGLVASPRLARHCCRVASWSIPDLHNVRLLNVPGRLH